MLFLFGILVGTIFSIFVGMTLFHLYGKTTHGDKANSLRKIFLSVPFLSLLIFALVCLAVSVIVEHLFLADPAKDMVSFLASPKTWLAFSKELFFAAFIALLIIVVVEVSSSDEQAELLKRFTEGQEKLVKASIDKAQESVFEGVYKNALDPAIFEEVVESIFRADFVREEHHRSMVLEPIDGKPDLLLMKVKQRYTVKNVTKSTKISKQRFYLPNTRNAEGHLNQFSRISITSKEGEDNIIPGFYPYSKGDSHEQTDAAEAVPGSELSDSGAEIIYTFPPVSVQAGGVIRIEIELQLVKDISDNEILTFLSSTLQGSFSVHSYVPNLDVKAISLHRGALTETPDGGADFKRWTFNRPMLPYQGYVVMWSKKLCCTNPVRDSSCESSEVAGVDEQTQHPELQDPELARV